MKNQTPTRTKHQKEPTPTPLARGTNPRARGTNPRALLGGFSIPEEGALAAAWASVPSWDRDHATEGHERLAAACAKLVGRRTPPADPASLVMAWLDRATSGDSLVGARSLQALLVGAARGRDPEADRAELARRLVEGRARLAIDRDRPAEEPPETPEPDPEIARALARLSGALRSPPRR